MATTDVYLRGALEPLRLAEPMGASALNMSAAARNGLLFFGGRMATGDDVLIAINQILYMRDVGE
jgi:hypothetical protein